MSIIKIKRSGSTGAPNTLNTGELAYSYLAGTETNGGDRLYVGTGVDGTTGLATDIVTIGGKYFTEKLDHTPGTLTANSAVIVGTDLKIDQFLVDDLVLDANKISINTGSLANTDLILQAGATGSIVLKSTVTFEANTDFNGQVTVASINVEDLTAGRVTYAGTAGELVDDSGFTYSGTGATATLTVDGTLDVQTEALLASAKVEDLTATRITYAGTGGELVDDAGLTYTGTGATGTLQVTGSIDVDVEATLASAVVQDLTNNRIVIAGVDGAIEDDANFTFDGTTFNVGANAEFTVAVASGDTQVKGTLDVDGQATLASVNVEDLTNDRIVIAGASGELEDDANFTFNGTELNVGAGKFTAQVTTGDLYTQGDVAVEGDIIVGSNTVTQFSVDSATGNIFGQGTLTLRDDIIVGPNATSTVFSVQGDTGNTQIVGTLDVDGQGTIASLNVQDLTAGRVTFAGTNGELEDSSSFLWTNSNTTLTVTGNVDIDGIFDADNIRIDGNTISSQDDNGNISIDPNGTGYVQIVGTNGLVIPVGTTAEQGPSVQGSIRYNSEINQFEGYSGTNWSSLGGVRSVDGLTYIIAEASPGLSDDTLYFYTANSNTTNIQAATLTSTTLTLNQGTSSTSTTSGSLVVTGGVGVSENVNVGGDVDIDGDLNVDGGDITTTLTDFNLLNTTATTINAFGAATQINIGAGGEGVGNTYFNTDVNLTGDLKVGANAMHVDAGTGDVLIGRDLTVTGDLVVNGNTTSINVSTLEVEDALIFLAANNTVSDSVDIGIAGQYFDATANTAKLTGIFRDSGVNEWFLFDEYADAVNNTDNNNINISSNTFSKGVLNVDKVNFSNTTIELTGDVAGTITIDHVGGGDGATNTVISIATTVQADSVELGTDTTGDYVQSISSNTATGISVTGTGESAVVTVAGVIADTAGQVGVATYNATNFDVSVGGEVTIDTIDGGTY